MLTPASGTAQSFYHDVVVLHAPELSLAEPSEHELESSAFRLSLVMNGAAVLETLREEQLARIPADDRADLSQRDTVVVVVAGTSSLTALRDAVLDASDYMQLLRGRLPLRGHVVTENGRVALVVDPNEALTRAVRPILT